MYHSYEPLGHNIVFHLKFCLLLSIVLFTDKKSHHDDDDSGMGPSISTTRKTTTVSEVSFHYFPTKLLVCKLLIFYTLGSSGPGVRGTGL